MLREADRAFVIDPKSAHLARDADATLLASFEALAPHIDELSVSTPGTTA